MSKSKVKKIGNVIVNILLYIFLAICIFSVFMTVLSKKDSDGAAEILGFQMRVVVSDSMAKCEHTDVSAYKIKDIPLRSMVFVKVMPSEPAKADEWYGRLKVGDVLTFRYVYTTQVTITHRITGIEKKDTGGYIIELAGDNKNSEDGQMVQTIDTSVVNNTNYVIGKVVGQSRIFGTIMTFLMKPISIVLVIIVPCFIIIMLEVIKIVSVVMAEKRKKVQEESERKDSELEELRRRLMELEKQAGGASDSAKENEKENGE